MQIGSIANCHYANQTTQQKSYICIRLFINVIVTYTLPNKEDSDEGFKNHKSQEGGRKAKNICYLKKTLHFVICFCIKQQIAFFFCCPRHKQNIAYISTFMMGIFGKNLSSNKSHKKVVVWFLLLFYCNAKYHLLTKTKETS